MFFAFIFSFTAIVLSVRMQLCLPPAILQTTWRLMETVCAVNLVSDTLKLNTAYRNSVNNADYIVQSCPISIVRHQKPSICIKTVESGVFFLTELLQTLVQERSDCRRLFFWQRRSEIADFHDSFR